MLTLQKVSQVAVKGSIVNVGEPKMKAMNKAICLAGELQNIAEPNIRTHLSHAIPAVQPKGILEIHFDKSPRRRFQFYQPKCIFFLLIGFRK